MRLHPRTFAALLSAALLLLLLGARVAPALASGSSATKGTVLILPVGTTSDVTLMETNAAPPLRRAGLGVTAHEDAELAGFDRVATVTCLDSDGECEHLLQKAPAEWILLLRVRRSVDGRDLKPTTANADSTALADADLIIIGKLFAASDSSLLQVEQRQCRRCNSSERLAQLVEELVADIANAELANQATATYINVSSTPANALLSIDGVVVGPTGQGYRVSPGDHEVSVSLNGYRTASQTVTVAANESKAITVGLAEKRLVGSRSGSGRRILTWSSLGLGVAALGAGAYWLVVDGDVTGSGNEPGPLRDTRTLGIASMVAGSVLVGAGIVLLLTQDDEQHEMQVSAGPYRDGLSIGISGHF